MTCGQEFTPNNVPNRALYNLNDPSGVHSSEAGARVVNDIILNYVKSPVEGEYTTQNTKKNVSEVQHQPQLLQTNNNKKFPKPFWSYSNTWTKYTRGNI